MLVLGLKLNSPNSRIVAGPQAQMLVAVAAQFSGAGSPESFRPVTPETSQPYMLRLVLRLFGDQVLIAE